MKAIAFFCLCLRLSASFELFKVDNFVSETPNDIGDTKSELINRHLDMIKAVQEKSKQTSCKVLIRNFLFDHGRRTQVTNFIDEGLKKFGVFESQINEYVEAKEIIYDGLIEHLLGSCFNSINAQSMEEKLTVDGVYTLTDDESDFMFGMMYAFEFENFSQKLSKFSQKSNKIDL